MEGGKNVEIRIIGSSADIGTLMVTLKYILGNDNRAPEDIDQEVRQVNKNTGRGELPDEIEFSDSDNSMSLARAIVECLRRRDQSRTPDKTEE